ncbi:MAG: UbiA family prenyltransferase [Aquificae bacterium]|nr:UbiA family prenyltransferase [Aquificota bacterium]
MKLLSKLKIYLELTKFEHSIFALPFALSAVVILEKGFPPLEKILWILVALISARTAGMAFNRFFDLPFDKLNPRTKDWASVKGLVKPIEILMLAIVSSVVFIFSAYMLNKLAFYLSPIVILFLILYPLGKRFTTFVHFILGIIYFLIPIAVSIALKGKIELSMIYLGLAMAFWVSGFDILYAIQDINFDKKIGLHSIPAKFGIKKALITARVFHLLTLIFLILTGISANLGVVYFTGLVMLGIFLIYEHSLITHENLSKINKAFFTVNGFISIIFFIIVFSDIYFFN